WNSQALHLGNGYFGASFFGGVEEEVFALSEASMWTGSPAMGDWEKAGVNPRARGSIPEIRKAVFSGDARRADSLIASDVFGSSGSYGHFTSIGDLRIRFAGHAGNPVDYIRELDLGDAMGRVSYRVDEVRFKREYFCSYPDRLLVMRFSADRPGQISMDISAAVIQDSSAITVSGNRLTVQGWIDGNNRPFMVTADVITAGGSIAPGEELLRIREADEVEVRLTIATDYRLQYPAYRGEQPGTIIARILEESSGMKYGDLKERHVRDYRSLFDRVSLSINGDTVAESLPTNERFLRFRAGGPDPGYLVLAFNLGRYMIISSSRPGTLPANLQGVWNTFRVAPWAGNYQSNINLQEIYWSCGPTALSECQEPYIDWIEDLSLPGREVARRVYGTSGWVSHTTGNIWGHAAPIGDHPWGMYPMGAAWHCQHVWDQFQFTGDTLYLEQRAYPLLKGASEFWLENLVPFGGYLATAPSVSAEHGALLTGEGLDPAYHDYPSDRYRYSLPGVYQDIQMIHELFTMAARSAGILEDTVFEKTLLLARGRLLPLKTGRLGQLQEWWQDID
ncbi:MAG: glycoside hydrolase family 95 protein, partial [Bacteroidetes bacterium]